MAADRKDIRAISQRRNESASARQRRHRPHWAACRKPDIRHAGRKFWQVPHDRERILLQYWYSETGPLGGDEFDVRDLPGWVDVGRMDFGAENLAEAAARHIAKEQAAHAAVIRACIDAGVDMLAVSQAAQTARDEAWRAEREAAASRGLSDDCPF